METSAGSGPPTGADKVLQNEDVSGERGKSRGWWRPVVLLAVIVAILTLAKVLGLDERLAALRKWIEGLGPWGPAVFSLLYVVAVVAVLPGSVVTVFAGALFGSVLGVILVSVAATVGASLSFLISRYFARAAVANWLSTKEKFRRLDQLTEDHGAIIVALTRLVPIFPFNLLNYGFTSPEFASGPMCFGHGSACCQAPSCTSWGRMP